MDRPGRQTPAARDAADIRRSYRFIYAVSAIGWAVVVGVVAATLASRATTAAVGAAVTLALLGWVLFLRGLERRELARIEGTTSRNYDPRSR